MKRQYTRVVCPDCDGAGEFETTTSDPHAIEPPTVLCRRCWGRGYVFVSVQQSLVFPDSKLPEDYDPFGMEEANNERDTCEV